MKRLRCDDAFSLVEVALALGIAAFCLVTVFGLLPVGISSNRTSLEQASAASTAANIVTDLRATMLANPPAGQTPSNQTTAYYQLTIPGTPAASPGTMHSLFLRSDGTPASTGSRPFQDQAIDPTQNPRYRATIYFTPNSAASQSATVTPRNAMTARVLITWPATADANPATAPSNFAGSLEAMTTLIRN